MRQVSSLDLELESLRNKKGNIARQIFTQTESAKSLTDSLDEARSASE